MSNDVLVIQVQDLLASIAQGAFTIPVSGLPFPTITTTPPLPLATVGNAFSFGFTAVGGTQPYTWTVVSTGANSWSFAGANLVGTPATAETDTLTIQVTDANGRPAFGTFQIIVQGNVSITTTSPLPGATQGSAYSTQMAATGGIAPYTWSLTSQTGLNGWSISSAGLITGTPATAETDVLSILVSDSELTPSSASGNFSIAVASLAQTATPVITPAGGTYTTAQTVGITDATGGASIYYTIDGTTPNNQSSTLLNLPSYTDLFGNTYVSGASGTSPDGSQIGSKPVNVPAGQIYMLAENKNPNPAVTNGFYLPNTWDAHTYTGFKPVNAGGHAQLSYAGTGTSPTSTMQWEGQQMGVLLLGSEMAAAPVRPQFTPQINFTNQPGNGPQLFTDSSIIVSHTLTIACANYVGSGSPQTPGNSPYISVNLGLCGPGAAWELTFQINVLAGLGPDVNTGYVAQALPAYQLKIPINAPIAASSNLCTFTAGTYQTGTFTSMIVSYSISYAQMQNILNFMAARNWGANPAFPSGLTPQQMTLNQAHVNAEMPNVNTISLGWSMSNWSVSTNGTSQLYSAPFNTTNLGTETVKAIAYATGKNPSNIASATYVIQPIVATPVISPATGTYAPGTTVTMSDGTAGATIHYTTTGVAPTPTSPTYPSGGFAMAASGTEQVQAIGVASGYTNSAVASQTYTISGGSGGPGAPTNLQLLFQGMNAAGNGIAGNPPIAQNQNTQAIGWTQGATGSFPITQNKIYRATNGGAFSLLATIAAGTSYTDTAATTCANGSSAAANSTGQFWPANGYLYQVTAVDNQGTESARSATQIFTMYKNGQVADTNGVLRIGYGFYDDVNTGGTTVNYSATGQSPPFGDTKCIAITGPAFFDLLMNTGNNCVRWNMWVGATSPAQVFQYLNISFKPSQANQTYNIWIEFRTAQNTDPMSGTPPYDTPGVTGVGSAAAVYGPQQQNGVWASYKIPLSALMQSTSSVGNPIQGMFYKLAISNQTNNPTTFYVDNIWLSPT